MVQIKYQGPDIISILYEVPSYCVSSKIDIGKYIQSYSITNGSREK